MRHRIQAVEARPGYRIWLQFADGTSGEVDLSDLVGKGVFAAWRDEHVFRAVSIDAESGTVVWPGGLDLAPDALYHDVAGVHTR